MSAFGVKADISWGTIKVRFGSSSEPENVSVLSWRNTDSFLKHCGEVRLTRKTSLRRDFGERHVSIGKQIARATDSAADYKLLRTFAGRGEESPREVGPR